MMALALTGKMVPYKEGFGPFPAECYHAPFPIDYHGVSVDASLAALTTLFHADVDPSRVAAMIVEPVLGEGGFYIAPPEFLRELRRLGDSVGHRLRKGAGAPVDKVARDLFREGGLDALREVAKVHFRTTKKAQGTV